MKIPQNDFASKDQLDNIRKSRAKIYTHRMEKKRIAEKGCPERSLIKQHRYSLRKKRMKRFGKERGNIYEDEIGNSNSIALLKGNNILTVVLWGRNKG